MFKKFSDYINESSIDDQILLKHEHREIQDFVNFLSKNYPKWEFKIISDMNVHPRITRTRGQILSYSSDIASKDEQLKVKEEIQKFKDSYK